MKTYPYNRVSREGRRLFRLLDVKFNRAELGHSGETRTFESYEVPSVLQCRANKVGFLFSSNLSGIKRPLVRVEADVELAWGNFADDTTTLDFTHGQELPLTYIQPLEDDTLKLLIDAGLYREERFEELMTKLMMDEMFDADADMMLTYLDAGENPKLGKSAPVIMVDPVMVVHEDYDASEHTTIASLVKRSAKLAIELRKEGVKTDDLVDAVRERDREVLITDTFQDVVTQKEEEQILNDADNPFTTSSPLLDQEIDVTDKLKGSLTFDSTTEDDRIRDLKERERAEDARAVEALDEQIEPPVDDSEQDIIPDISEGYDFEKDIVPTKEDELDL